MKGRKALGAGLLALAHFLGAGLALADSAAAPREEALLEVEVRLVGKAGRDPVFAQRIASWFDVSRFRVQVVAAPWLDAERVLAPERGANVYVWVTVNEQRARLYFASMAKPAEKTTYLLRDLPLQQGLDEIGAEQVAQAIHFSTLALLEGQLESSRTELEQSLRTEQSKAPAALPAPASPPPERDGDPAGPEPSPASFELSPGVGYGITFRGDAEGVGHGPRASLTLALSRRWLLGTRVSALLPLERAVGPVDLKLYGASLALTGGIRQSLGSDFAVEAYAGPDMEIVRYEPLVESSVLSPGRPETELRPRLTAGLSGAFGRWPRLALIAEVAFVLSDTHYDLIIDGQRQEIGRPWPVMPSLGIELRL